MSEKEHIAIPVDIRRDSGVAPGEELVVLRRMDGSGIPMLN
ncbi:MAG: hypothetical protein U9Q37_07125 [Euryarchaeota archaeon]|nr:hypothetical protein [Euryarchaeota archaeon]